MIELATTIEQSKKLVELGLNLDTADMHYSADMYDSNYDLDIGKGIYEELPNWVGTKNRPADIPAWSLSALIELMPLEIYDKMFSDGKVGSFRTFEFAIETNQRDNNRYKIKYRLVSVREFGKYLKICEGRTLLDASYNMVGWLLEHKHINTK